MNKYIIKNCPACHNYSGNIYNCEQMRDTLYELCKDYTNCLLKRIVEKCYDYELYSSQDLVEEILSMLDIEECEE